jgi:hypothetical protein
MTSEKFQTDMQERMREYLRMNVFTPRETRDFLVRENALHQAQEIHPTEEIEFAIGITAT